MEINIFFRKRMNKRGWIIIVESFIAILIITTAFLLIHSKNSGDASSVSEEIYNRQRSILEVIAYNESLRNEIITRNNLTVHEFIEKNINPQWNYLFNICSLNDICNSGIPTDRDIYVSETIISATPTNFPGQQATKVRLFFWKK
ncbi:MAG: hypothetical protein AABX16_01695 [Nanoarchaeota archaeon]